MPERRVVDDAIVRREGKKHDFYFLTKLSPQARKELFSKKAVEVFGKQLTPEI